MKRFWAAVGFLTVMPLPSVCRHTQKDLVQSVPLFPIIGLLIGLSAAGIAALLDSIFQTLVSSVILVGWLALTHGAFHLDGLSDTADGFFSHHGRDRVLEIMGDSHVGAFGCLAIGGILAIKVAALVSLPAEGRVKAALLAPLAGRCIMAPMLFFLPPARPDGLGRLFGGHRPFWESLWAAAFLMVAAWFTARVAGLIAGFSVMTVTAAFGFLCKRRIGGNTGDTVGAASEIAEAVALLTLSAQPVVNLWG
jgi:adenosylcobinamide-GDP ribazoletransferase